MLILEQIDNLMKVCSTRDLVPSNEIVDELLDIRNTLTQEDADEHPEPV